jgi:glycerol-3-phosphate acyltransferase PlsY|tara:strand:- start:118 stop:699 length:582 start_codon:yes stop_codon:yes gene_type:complete
VNLELILVFIYSYVLGSIPFGLIITKIFLKEDIRNIGSGNIGATNVLRTGKKILAASTLLFDILKGYLTIYITSIYFKDLLYFAALICFVGHIFPIWLKFKGGKGIATFLGIILAFSYNLAIIFGLSWLIIFFIFKYSSLSSIIAAFVVLIYSFLIVDFSLSFYLFSVFIIILFTHRENIMRLRSKNENKIKF